MDFRDSNFSSQAYTKADAFSTTLGDESLAGVLELFRPLAQWCVRSGVGHSQFSRASKHLFYEAAEEELKRQKLKRTDSSLSLLSGLHKGDVLEFKAAAENSGNIPAERYHKISPSSQVVAHWHASGWPYKLPIKGEGVTFQQLVANTDCGVSPKLILEDLERRGLVIRKGKEAILQTVSEISSKEQEQSQELIDHFIESSRDHITACVVNLESTDAPRFLEQSLVADGLYPESVEVLHAMGRVWWMKAVQDIGARAIALCNHDEPRGGRQRMRLGVYFYTAEQDHKPEESGIGNISTQLTHKMIGKGS